MPSPRRRGLPLDAHPAVTIARHYADLERQWVRSQQHCCSLAVSRCRPRFVSSRAHRVLLVGSRRGLCKARPATKLPRQPRPVTVDGCQRRAAPLLAISPPLSAPRQNTGTAHRHHLHFVSHHGN